MSLSAGLVVVYGLVPYLDVEKVPTINPAISLTYGPLHRAAWALAIGWVVWACVRGYGGIRILLHRFSAISDFDLFIIPQALSIDFYHGKSSCLLVG